MLLACSQCVLGQESVLGPATQLQDEESMLKVLSDPKMTLLGASAVPEQLQPGCLERKIAPLIG